MPLVIRNKDTHLEIDSYDLSDAVDHVPAMVYRLMLTQEGIMLAKDRNRFQAPEKYYGELESHRDRIIDTYLKRKMQTGALFTGEKGSGKTALTEAMANKMIQMDIPVIMITNQLPPQVISSVVKAVQPCMVMIDEFEKIYDEEDQEGLLPLFSDSDLNGVLFALTGNDRSGINKNFLNRPGRLLFGIEFETLDGKVADELIREYSLPKTVHELITFWVGQAREMMSFDLLKEALEQVSECTNPEQVLDCLSIINVPPIPLRILTVKSAFIRNDNGDVNNLTSEVTVDRLDNVVTVSGYDKNGTYHEGHWDLYDRSVVSPFYQGARDLDFPHDPGEASVVRRDPISRGIFTIVEMTNGLSVLISCDVGPDELSYHSPFIVLGSSSLNLPDTDDEEGEEEDSSSSGGITASAPRHEVVSGETEIQSTVQKIRANGKHGDVSVEDGVAVVPVNSVFGPRDSADTQEQDAISRGLGLPSHMWDGSLGSDDEDGGLNGA